MLDCCVDDCTDPRIPPPPLIIDAAEYCPRPPRICGAIKETYFSAAVTPVRRSVRVSAPCWTGAVRTAATVGPPPEPSACGRVKYHVAQPATASTRTSAPQGFRLRGSSG